MKITYTAEDGTEFSSSDACLAYEERSGVEFETWKQKLIDESNEDHSGDTAFDFIIKAEVGAIQLTDFEEFWVYRRKLIQLAKSFSEFV